MTSTANVWVIKMFYEQLEYANFGYYESVVINIIQKNLDIWKSDFIYHNKN